MRAGACVPRKAKLAKESAGLVVVSIKVLLLPSTTNLQGYEPEPPMQGMPRKRSVVSSPAVYPSMSMRFTVKGVGSPADPIIGLKYGPRAGGLLITREYTQCRRPEEGDGLELPWVEPLGGLVRTVFVAEGEATETEGMGEGLGAALPEIPGRLGGRWNTRGKFTGSLSISPV
jgi:hypothetical protein